MRVIIYIFDIGSIIHSSLLKRHKNIKKVLTGDFFFFFVALPGCPSDCCSSIIIGSTTFCCCCRSGVLPGVLPNWTFCRNNKDGCSCSCCSLLLTQLTMKDDVSWSDASSSGWYVLLWRSEILFVRAFRIMRRCECLYSHFNGIINGLRKTLFMKREKCFLPFFI